MPQIVQRHVRTYRAQIGAFSAEVPLGDDSFCGEVQSMSKKLLLDRIDRRILTILQRDGRISNHRLSEQVALSPSACLSRVRRLEAEGVITGYRAQVDPAKLGPNLTVFAEIRASGHDLATTRRIEAALMAIPQAIEAYQVSGSYDFLVRFLVPDMEHWTVLADELADGELTIETVRTIAVMRKLKGWAGVPVDLA